VNALIIPRVAVSSGLLAASMFLVLLVAGAVGRQSVLLPSLEGVTSYQCATGSDVGDVFRVLTLTFDGASELAERLCAAPELASVFSQVRVTWRSRDYLQASHIVNEDYDYLWSRDHLLRGLVPDVERYYQPLLQTPGYNIFWLSRVGPVQLEPAFFADKRLGFLDDSHSQTFYVQPFLALKEAGVELRPDQQRLYPDVTLLRQALQDGLVDIIPGAALPVGLSEDQFNRTLMVSGMSSGAWYLRPRYFDGRLECALLDATRESVVFGDNRVVPAQGTACSTSL
jgi:hypothetical protein